MKFTLVLGYSALASAHAIFQVCPFPSPLSPDPPPRLSPI